MNHGDRFLIRHITYCPYVAVFYSPYSTRNSSAATSRVQVGFGFETEYRFTKDIGISAGLELANFGVKGSSTLYDRYGPVHTFENEYKMKTLSLPLMLNFHPLASNRLSLQIGVQPGWLIQTSSDKLSSRGMCFAVPIGVAVGAGSKPPILGVLDRLSAKNTSNDKGKFVTLSCEYSIVEAL